MNLFVLLLHCLLLFTFQQTVLGKDYYESLQLSRGASDQQIKRAYRKLALKYHPDKVQGTEDEKAAAAKRFADINTAYEVLSDPEKKQIYDRYGEEGLKQQQGQGGGGQGQNIFDFFFGGDPFGRGREEEEQIQKGHTVVVDLFVNLKDLYVGKEMQVTRDKNVIKPAAGKRKCKCKQKLVTRQVGPGMFQQYTQQVCEECPAVKFEREQEVMTVHVEPGMVDGQEIPFFEEGEPMIDGESGDLKFIIRTLPNDMFERRGRDLIINHTISLVDSLTGFRHEISHLDGHLVTLQADGVTKHNSYHYIEGEGMPISGNEHKHGDLFVYYNVEFPDTITAAQRDAIKAAFS